MVCIDVDVYDLTEPSQKVDFLMRTVCRRKKGETSVVVEERAERFSKGVKRPESYASYELYLGAGV